MLWKHLLNLVVHIHIFPVLFFDFRHFYYPFVNRKFMVDRGRIERPTFGFSDRRSNQLSYLSIWYSVQESNLYKPIISRLHYRCANRIYWSWWQDSNLRLRVPKTRGVTWLSYIKTFYLIGADNGTWTHNFLIGSQKLYQLSYIRIFLFGTPNGNWTHISALKGQCSRPFKLWEQVIILLVLKIGLEPTTFSLQVNCTASCATPAYLVDDVGVAPTTSCLQNKCSPDWTNRPILLFCFGIPARTRTLTNWFGASCASNYTTDIYFGVRYRTRTYSLLVNSQPL